MKKLTKDKVLATIFIAIALLVNGIIIYHSCLTGIKSAEVSGSLTDTLTDIINTVKPDTITDLNYESFATFIRKGLGHFGAFMVSGIFTFLAVHYSSKHVSWYRYYWGMLISFIFGLTLASTTEIIQLTVDSRSGQLSDVLLDSVG
ncbi:MAG: VanZ family protein, partial [Erysipelotrichia bacterium]|nr:VanZ family protein [Erysipelotrichia bacterium]